MQLEYTSPELSTIRAVLDEGERLGNITGPTTAFVPVAPENAEYADLLARELVVPVYVAPPPPVPETISDRQFFVQLALDGEITETEAEAALATGTIPAEMAAAIETLPAANRFQARAFVKGATTFERHHPMTLVLAGLLGFDEAKLDQLWRDASGL